MRKAFVLDTNVLLNSPNAILSFKNSEIIIPLAVLRELDNFKVRNDTIGKNARNVNRLLDEYRQVGNLLKGISLENNSKLFIKTIKNESFELLPDGNAVAAVRRFFKADCRPRSVAALHGRRARRRFQNGSRERSQQAGDGVPAVFRPTEVTQRRTRCCK